jgi:acetolactate synthase small subunit
MLLKVNTNGQTRGEIVQLSNLFGAEIIDVRQDQVDFS